MGLTLNERDRALVALGRELRARGYRFVTPTPATHARLLEDVPGELDVVIANPPYLVDDDQRLYRHGGSHGIELSVRIVDQALARAKTLVLYTATPIVDGVDPLFEALAPSLEGHACEYAELDPDVFGEELDRPAYRAVERIAVVSLVVSR